MADEQDQAEALDDEQLDLDDPTREDPEGDRIDGASEREEHLADDPTPLPAEEAAVHVESQ